MPQTPYEILGIDAHASSKEIKRLYKKLIRQYTPEHHAEKFMSIRAAYDAILKPDFLTKDFPVYHKPLEIIAAITAEATATEKDRELSTNTLTEVFETPFNTVFELKTVLAKDKI